MATSPTWKRSLRRTRSASQAFNRLRFRSSAPRQHYGRSCRTPLGRPSQTLYMFLQLQRIARCVTGVVIVEVHVHRLEFAAPAQDAIGPLAQLLIGVAALILAAGPMQPHVGEIGGDQDWGMKSRQLVNAIRSVMA